MSLELFDTRSKPPRLSEVGWIQLLASPGGVELVTAVDTPRDGTFSETVIASAPLDRLGSPTPAIVLPHLARGAVPGDVLRREDGALFGAFELPTGGSSVISLRGERGSTGALSGPSDAYDFASPRFFRDTARRASGLVAVLDAKRIAVFGAAGHGSMVHRATLGEAVAGVVVVDSHGPALITKTIAPGHAGDERGRPGTLSYVRLGGDMLPVGTAVPLLSGTVVYELDALGIGDDGFVVAATTASGLTVGWWRGGPHGLEALGRDDHAAAGPLSSPSLAAAGGTLHVAALRSRGTKWAQVMVGTVRVAP